MTRVLLLQRQPHTEEQHRYVRGWVGEGVVVTVIYPLQARIRLIISMVTQFGGELNTGKYMRATTAWAFLYH